MNENSSTEQQWNQCPQGLLQQVADRTASSGRILKDHESTDQFDRRKMLQIAAAVAVTGAAGTIAYQSLFPRVSPNSYGGITCAKFLANAQKHIEKKIEDEQLVSRMDKHLELCKACKVRYERMRNA